MTRRALEKRVARDRFHALDLGVAGGAGGGGSRRHRVVGVVARNTGLEGIVGYRVDLWEARRPRRVVRVADRAELPVPWRRRLHRRGVLRVFHRRTMAPLAREILVKPLALPRSHVLVAGLAGLGSRE